MRFGDRVPHSLGSQLSIVAPLSKTTSIRFAGFTAYFGVFLLPKVFPAVGASLLMLILAFSLLSVLLASAGLASWRFFGTLLSWRRKRPLSAGSRRAGQPAVAGLGAFVLVLVLSHIIPNPLPTGSDLSEFDPSVWLDPNSVEYVRGDITPRQKMLAAVIAKLPGRNRTELEHTLGPSLETPYFMSTDRDLIYLLGPQRDALFAIDSECDSEWLLIWLDETGMFERYEIAND